MHDPEGSRLAPEARHGDASGQDRMGTHGCGVAEAVMFPLDRHHDHRRASRRGLLLHCAGTWRSRLRGDGPAMFGPVISQVWVPERAGISSRPWRPEAPADRTPPPLRWTFPAIDLWPSAPGWSPTLSEFAPVTNARPDPPEMETFLDPQGRLITRPAIRHSSLRMIRWLRPVYASECSAGTAGRSVVLDLLIDSSGQPVEVKVVQSSGQSELDDAGLGAAREWRFAPPLWQSRPVQTRGRIELRFNC